VEEWRRSETSSVSFSTCGSLGGNFNSSAEQEKREREEWNGQREELGFSFNSEPVGALPRRGVRGLAAEGGERGQEKGDKKGSGGCAGHSIEVRRYHWRQDR
jgi:hypothetical protein